jgi:recombination protein RecT
VTIKTSANGQIQPKAQQAQMVKAQDGAGLVGLLKSLGPEIQRALPKHLTADRMARVALTAIRSTPNLINCTPASFAACVMSAAQLGLEVNTPLGEAYLIPRRAGDAYECTLIVGYQGMISLALRSPRVRDIYAVAVRKGDRFEYEMGLDRTLRHVPSDDDGEVTHAYAVADLGDGVKAFVVLTRKQIEKRRPKHATRGPWADNFAAMAQKTAIRELYKWIPKSIEMATAAAIDETVERGGVVSQAADSSVIDVLVSSGLEEPAPLSIESALEPGTNETTEEETPS